MSAKFIEAHNASDYYDQVNTLNYATLVVLATAEVGQLGRFTCLKPICKSQNKVIEKRKSETVQVLINHKIAGSDLADIPDICNCANLATCDCIV